MTTDDRLQSRIADLEVINNGLAAAAEAALEALGDLSFAVSSDMLPKVRARLETALAMHRGTQQR